jgi:hypothetical protein
MSVLTDTWRQLVRRRLWPVALLLVAALAAVPVLLTREPEADVPAAAPAAPAEGRDVLASEPVVALATAQDRGRRRRVLGARHDIFKATAKKPKATKAESAETTDDAAADVPAAAEGGSGGGTAVPAPAPAPVAEPAPPAPTWPANSVTVRFGDAAAEGREKQTLRRGRPLPSAEAPVAIYLRLEDDGKTAVFLLPAGVEATGDGTCRPSRPSCEQLELRVGDIEFLDVLGEDEAITAQYQLELIAIHDVTKDKPGSEESGTRLIKARAALAGRPGWAR